MIEPGVVKWDVGSLDYSSYETVLLMRSRCRYLVAHEQL